MKKAFLFFIILINIQSCLAAETEKSIINKVQNISSDNTLKNKRLINGKPEKEPVWAGNHLTVYYKHNSIERILQSDRVVSSKSGEPISEITNIDYFYIKQNLIFATIDVIELAGDVVKKDEQGAPYMNKIFKAQYFYDHGQLIKSYIETNKIDEESRIKEIFIQTESDKNLKTTMKYLFPG